MTLTRIQLDTVDSTSNFLRRHPDPQPDEIVVATAEFQTAGRGQASNSWESLPGQNLLFSLLTAPVWLPLEHRFLLSMAGALAVRAALLHALGSEAAAHERLTLKWPNDIYFDDSKISGTLIETALKGKAISRCVYGIGVNVNQRQFFSSAPNPISLRQITGRETDREQLLGQILLHFERFYLMLRAGEYSEVRRQYHQHLYRRSGLHEFIDCHGAFLAEIAEVKDNGRISLRDTQGNIREYELKEIQHGKI